MKSAIRRVMGVFLLILLAFLLQNTFFAAIPLVQTTPNLLLLVTVSLGLLHGKETGLVVGFFVGLLMDMFGGTLLGQYALIQSVLGYCCGFMTPYFFMEDVILPLCVCGICEVIYGIYIYVFSFLLRGRLDFFYYFKSIIVPEMIYTLLILLLVYRFIMFVNLRLISVAKRRSASKFV